MCIDEKTKEAYELYLKLTIDQKQEFNDQIRDLLTEKAS